MILTTSTLLCNGQFIVLIKLNTWTIDLIVYLWVAKYHTKKAKTVWQKNVTGSCDHQGRNRWTAFLSNKQKARGSNDNRQSGLSPHIFQSSCRSWSRLRECVFITSLTWVIHVHHPFDTWTHPAIHFKVRFTTSLDTQKTTVDVITKEHTPSPSPYNPPERRPLLKDKQSEIQILPGSIICTKDNPEYPPGNN